VQFWEKNIQHPKKSIFNDWSVSEISSILYFIIKYILYKNVSCWKNSQGGSIYKIIITKYLNIAIAEHAHVVVVENGGCNTSHSQRVEQAFYTKYTWK
jgi:hypothetical protein